MSSNSRVDMVGIGLIARAEYDGILYSVDTCGFGYYKSLRKEYTFQYTVDDGSVRRDVYGWEWDDPVMVARDDVPEEAQKKLHERVQEMYDELARRVSDAKRYATDHFLRRNW